jgi:hypothetical protein
MPFLSVHLHSLFYVGRAFVVRLRGPVEYVTLVVQGRLSSLEMRACSCRRRVRGRGILNLLDLAFLAAALQGDFFLVDGHGVWVGLFAAAGALEICVSECSRYS